MTTELLNTDTAGGGHVPGEGETLTAAERAYLSSRGADTSILGAQTPQPGAAPTPEKSPPDPAAQPDAEQPMTDENGDLIEGEITIDEQGNARSKRNGQFVPKSAYLRVSDDAKRAKQNERAMRDQLLQTRERLAILSEATEPTPQQKGHQELPSEPIDPERDIFGAFKQAMATITDLKTQLQQVSSTTEIDRVGNAFRQDAARFQASQPAFLDAFAHLTKTRDTELEIYGVGDAAERARIINEEALGIIKAHVLAGRSPSEALFKLAQTRGFAPKQQPDAAKAAQDQLDRIAKGQEAAMSLRGVGTSGVPTAPTREQVANMGEGDFASFRRDYIARNGVNSWRQFIGG